MTDISVDELFADDHSEKCEECGEHPDDCECSLDDDDEDGGEG